MDAVTLTDAGLTYVREKLEKLNCRADKLGLPRVQLHVETKQEPIFADLRGNEKPQHKVGFNDVEYTRTNRVCNVHHVTVEGPAPVLAGYRVVARIDHLSEGNIINKAPDVPELDKHWRHADATCQHCLVTRRRNSTFLLKNADADTDTLIQVGRNCLADYVRDPAAAEAIVQWGSWVADLEHTIREASGRSGGETLYDVAELTRAAILVANKFGWVSKKMAQDDQSRIPTVSRVFNVIHPPRDKRYDDPEYPAIRTALAEGHGKDEADAVCRWVLDDLANRDENEVSDYFANLVVAFKQGAISHRYAGLVCSAFAAHRRELAEERKQEEEKAAAAVLPQLKHVGTVGERLRGVPAKVVKVQSLGISEFNGRTSERFLCKFVTPEGDPLVWFTGENLPYEEGQDVVIDATVTKHDTYNGRPSTIVQRVNDAKPVKTPKRKAKS